MTFAPYPLPTDYVELDRLRATPGLSLCWSHHLVEPVPEDPYRVCFECGHVYETAQALVDAWNDAAGHIDESDEVDFEVNGPVPRFTVENADQIFFCQECIHDF